MKVITFVSESLEGALAQIQQQLGPEAVVLSIRPVTRHGLGRILSSRRSIEVLACLPEPEFGSDRPLVGGCACNSMDQIARELFTCCGSGLNPLTDAEARPHVFIGPPGSGKTTLLCKWMTRASLQDGTRIHVWRLDHSSANTAEFLNVYCELLGLSVERGCPASSAPEFDGTRAANLAPPAGLMLVDMPGAPFNNTDALLELKRVLASLPGPRLHLVLNAAYDRVVLKQQLRAFSRFNPEDVSFCHLDETESPLEKLRELLAGTNYSVRFLSTGQKIPGEFFMAPELVPQPV